MLRNRRARFVLLGSAALLGLALPVLGQDSPESILPPGFGDAEPARPPSPKPSAAPKPSTARPTQQGSGSDGSGASGPRLDIDIDGLSSAPSGSSVSAPRAVADGTEETSEDELVDAPVLPDLPPFARRPVEMAGLLGPESDGLGLDAFSKSDGAYLARIMQGTRAPIASRWASILLRRTLLTRAVAPKGIDPADWAAERVWLLVRMGEADPARMLASVVDADRQTSRMRDMTLQAALASSDPASACPAVDHAPGAYKEAQWMLARAMCNGFAGESAQASALVDSVRDKGLARNIDTLLAEKVVGAAGNTRRSVKVQWDKVTKLTVWRYGLATATGVEIPANLLPADAMRLRAWRARAPLRTATRRLEDADFAAGLGVFSNTAMVDLYAAAYDETDPADRSGKPFMQMRNAYAGETSGDRVDAITSLWGEKTPDTVDGYGRLVATARAAALVTPSSDFSSEADRIVAAILSAGLTEQASRWADVVGEGSVGWAQLVLAVPELVNALDGGDVSGLDEGVSGRRNQLFLAGATALGLLPIDEANSVSNSLEAGIGKQDSWTRAIDKAAAEGDQGGVVLLAALGLQGQRWADVPTAYLYRAVASLRRVGLQQEARLIAAEAVARS